MPIFTSTWIVGTVLGAGIYYGEFVNVSGTQAGLFALGVVLCCVGVFFLVQDVPSGGGIDKGGEDVERANQQQQQQPLPTHQADITDSPTSKPSIKAPLLGLTPSVV